MRLEPSNFDIRRWTFCGLALLCFTTVAYRAYHTAPGPIDSGDTEVWPQVAQLPLNSLSFYTSSRPFTVPLVYKLARLDTQRVMAWQTGLSVLCWYTLGLAIASTLSSGALQGLVLIVICGFSLCIPINQWNMVMRSESLCLSLFALVLALTLWLLRHLSRPGHSFLICLICWACACLLFVGTRDSVTYVLLLLWIGMMVWLIIQAVTSCRQRQGNASLHRLLICCVLLGSIIYFGQWSTRHSPRWHTLYHVVLQRIIPHPEIYRLWQNQYDLPVNPAFESYAGKSLWHVCDDGLILRQHLGQDEELSNIRQWFQQRGVSSYARYLLWDHAMGSIRESANAMSIAINEHQREYADWTGATPVTTLLTRLLYPFILTPILMGWGGFILGLSLVVCKPPLRWAATLGLFLLINAVVQGFIGYHGDSIEVSRHLMLATCSYRLGLLVLTLCLLSLLSLSTSVKPVQAAG